MEAREYALLRDHPDLDRVLAGGHAAVAAAHPAAGGRARGAGARSGGSARRVRAGRFDVAIDLQGLIKSGLLTAYTGAPLRIGFAAAHCRERLNVLFTNRRVTPPAERRPRGGPVPVAPRPARRRRRAAPEFQILPIAPRPTRRMDDFLGEQGVKTSDRVVALNPGAGRPDKRGRWRTSGALAERLGTEADARVLLLWGPDEIHMARQIGDGLPCARAAGAAHRPRTSWPRCSGAAR